MLWHRPEVLVIDDLDRVFRIFAYFNRKMVVAISIRIDPHNSTVNVTTRQKFIWCAPFPTKYSLVVHIDFSIVVQTMGDISRNACD